MSFWVAVAIAFVAGDMAGFLMCACIVAGSRDAERSAELELEALRAERAEWQETAVEGLLG